MKQYLLSIYQPDEPPPAAETIAPVMKRVDALLEEARAAGVLVLNGGLEPPASASVVHLRRGNTVVTDGPFAETKECLGGFMIVRAPHREAALEWARKLARALTIDGTDGLPIEVRAFQAHA